MEGPTALAPLPTAGPPSGFANTPPSMPPQSLYTAQSFEDITSMEGSIPITTPAKVEGGNSTHTASSWADTPAHVTDHGLLSNVRGGSGDRSPEATKLGPDAAPVLDEVKAALPFYEEPSTPSNTVPVVEQQQSASDQQPQEAEFSEHEAYAMLRFPDSHALITSLNLVITRDEHYMSLWRQEKKKRKDRVKAQLALQSYAKEPSHRSEDGLDQDPSSRSGDGEELEGRPARGLLSNYSEQGGPVAFVPTEYEELDEYEVERVRRRNRKNNNSSTSNSVAPADLHLFQSGLLEAGNAMGTSTYVKDGTESDLHEWAALPVHTANLEDITRVSREHLIFSYDTEYERWVLHVVGNGAVVNGVQYPKGTRDIELQHDDEIFISTVAMRFALPAGLDQVTDDDEDGSVEDVLDSVEDASNIGTSPIRRLSRAFGATDSEEEDADDAAPVSQKSRAPKKPPKLKLKLSNKKASEKEGPGKTTDKTKGLKHPKDQAKAGGKTLPKADAKSDAKDAGKRPEKGKKPKAAAPDDQSAEKTTEAAGEGGTSQPKPTQASPPAVPLNLDPGSVLAGLEPDQMPEKRKGPGRPPKNGVLSKRDESGVKRKRKEYERQGLPVPELTILLDEVRREQRLKDALSKAQARGEPAPEMAVPSIERDGAADQESGQGAVARESHGQDGNAPAFGDGRASSPKPPRRIKSPSPIPPESSFTEEDLKKPNMTYIYIINEILETIEGGQADLQTIYDKIQKKWPYFKYRVTSLGWQSSVRHNLLSCDRFKDAGKSGKGKMWTINTEHPLDNKKRKPTPPPRPPQMPMANGQMPYQYGQNGYQQYGQQQYHPHGPYASPYNGGPVPPNGQYPHHGGPSRPAYQPPPQQPPNPFSGIVQDILEFRTKWLDVSDSEELSRRTALIDKATEHFSNVYHNGKTQSETAEPDFNVEEEPFRSLKTIFERHPNLFSKKTQDQATSSVQDNGEAAGPTSNVNVGVPVAPEAPRIPLSNTNTTGAANQVLNATSGQPSAMVSGGTVGGGVPAHNAPNSHGHPSVQQQIGNAVTSRMPPGTTGEPPKSQVNGAIPASPANGVATPESTFAPSAPMNVSAAQPSQQVYAPVQQPAPTGPIPAPVPAAATPSGAAPIAAASVGSTGPRATMQSSIGSNASPIGVAAAHSTATFQPSTEPKGIPSAAGYGTPKAPTPEALSRPASAGNGSKAPSRPPSAAGDFGIKRRPAEDTEAGADGDHEAKRQRTS